MRSKDANFASTRSASMATPQWFAPPAILPKRSFNSLSKDAHPENYNTLSLGVYVYECVCVCSGACQRTIRINWFRLYYPERFSHFLHHFSVFSSLYVRIICRQSLLTVHYPGATNISYMYILYICSYTEPKYTSLLVADDFRTCSHTHTRKHLLHRIITV